MKIPFETGSPRAGGGDFFIVDDRDHQFMPEPVSITFDDSSTASFTPTTVADASGGLAALCCPRCRNR